MNDLNTINRLNAEAFGDKVARARAAGKHVLVYKAGVAVTNFIEFDTAQEAQLHATGEGELAVDVTRHYFAPTTPSADPLLRDQSEDRVLGDYVNRTLVEEGLTRDAAERV